MKEIFDIEKFNVISDEENYYFFRSLEPGDIEDLEKGIIKDGENYTRLRTDRERWEETHQEKPRWNSESKVTLEEMYNHIKMHYSLQTNCISLSSNANVARTYGEAFSDKYVMIKVPKREMGEKVFHAGQYMLHEIQKQVEQVISYTNIPESIMEDLKQIDEAKTSDEIKEIIKTRYKSEKELDESKKGLRKGITYKSPHARVSSYQSLNEEQTLEKNKIIAKLTVLEHKKIMKPLMSRTANNNLLIQTVGSSFSSSEQIYYGDIEGDRITDISKEVLDMFGLLQQAENQDKQIVDELKRKWIKFVNEGKQIEILDESIFKRDNKVKEDITIDEMYELTEGKVEYGQANSIVKNMFYLAKGQSNARALAQILREMTNDNPRYERVIEYIENNGFEIEPKISTRQSNKGYRLSESVNLNLKSNEIGLVEQIKGLTDEEQIEILENGGLSNVRNIMTANFAQIQRQEQISRDEYYAEAIFSSYDWNKIGIEEFTVAERNNLLQKIQDEHCVDLYKKLEEKGIDRKDIPTILLNIVTRKNDFEIEEEDTNESIKEKRLEQYDKIIEEDIEDLNQELSIERIERFLGYYDIQGTGIQLRPYQQRAVARTDEIFKGERFASVILPTGAGKSFVTLAQLLEHKDEEMLYLAPQNEILEQMKDYIIKYIHGPVNTIGRTKDEIVADIFPNLKFSTYPGLLAKDGEEIINKEYGFVVLDELHRTGAKEWGDRLNTLIDNQIENTKVLGITATPRRDSDGINMANEMAERLGYTNKEAVSGKHIAMNMSLTNAIRMGLVVNPKLVSCAYTLKTDGSLDKLKGQIDQIEDVQERNEKLEKYETLRRNLEEAEGIPEILQANVKKGGKYIVFLPIVDEIEDEDGNVIGRKKGKEKLADYEKQIAEYFKGSDITSNFHSMLGEYGDKDNERRLEEFQNRNTDDTEFMLVMNKANEGLHLDKLDGMIWLRPMDENSRILYLQQLGRVIYSEDPDNPTKDEDRPIVIDLVNNTLKVNWDNEITEQDDIEMLNIIVDWAERHDGTLPNINSTDKEESGYATVLKEIQNKYKEYLDNDFDDLNEKQIEEVQEILRLGSLIDLWQSELPDRIAKNGGNHERNFGYNDAGPFELTGILNNFVELKDETNIELITKSIQEQILEFIKDSDIHRMPRSTIRENGKVKSVKEMTAKENYEINLYVRWRKSEEKRVLEKYTGKPMEEVPKEYKDFIRKMREYGYGTEIEKNMQEQILEFLKSNDTHSMPRSHISERGKRKKLQNMTLKEQEETNLYQRWNKSEEKRVLEKYTGRPMEEVPEKYKEFIRKMREYGYGVEKEKNVQEQVLEFIESSANHSMPRGYIKDENGKKKTLPNMTSKERDEINLYQRWNRAEEKRILEKYTGKPMEEVPKEYKEFIRKMREYGYGTEIEKNMQEQMLEFIESNANHSMPRCEMRDENRKRKKRKNMTSEERDEVHLYQRWNKSEEKRVLEKYTGRPMEEVPEKYKEFIRRMREYGYGEKKGKNVQEKVPKKRKNVQEEVLEFIESSANHSMPRSYIKDENEKKKIIKDMTPEERDEINLYRRWSRSKEKKLLEEYTGMTMEEVPKEHKEFISKMREYGYGLEREKNIQEEILKFIDSSNGHRLPRTYFPDENGKHKKVEDMTSEENYEINLYIRWIRSKEKKIFEEYVGRNIKEVPEEFKEFISKMREYGYGLEREKNIQEQILEFIENNANHSMPRSYIKDENGKIKTVKEKTEEENYEQNLYARWRRSEEKNILDRYAEKTIEEVPEEYRDFISKMREYGHGIKKKKRTGKEIAEATISSLKDIEMADNEDAALKKLAEKTKEGGIKIDEQS